MDIQYNSKQKQQLYIEPKCSNAQWILDHFYQLVFPYVFILCREKEIMQQLRKEVYSIFAKISLMEHKNWEKSIFIANNRLLTEYFPRPPWF